MKLEFISHEHFIYKDKIDEEIGKKLLETVLKIKQKRINLLTDASNVLAGSFEKGSQFHLDRQSFDLFNLAVTQCFTRYQDFSNKKKADLLPMKLKDAWVNIADAHSYNPVHKHSQTYSGVVFLSLDPHTIDESIDEGKLFFNYGIHDPKNLQFLGTKKYYPKKFDFLLFPSWQEHFVMPTHHPTDLRISIAFNMGS